MKHKRPIKYNPSWAKNYLPYEGLLGQRLLGQEEAVMQMASILASFKNRPISADFPAPRILLVGGPSTGKTYLADLAVGILDIPFVHINLASVSPPGYRGFDINVGLKNLIEKSSVQRAERSSAIILDEADKIIRRGESEHIKQIEYSLLPVLNGDRLLVDSDEYSVTAKSFSTKNSIIFAMGVFPGIRSAVWDDPEKAKKALVKFGFTHELVSRFTHFIYLKPLKKEAIKKLVEREALAHSTLYQSEDFKPTLTPQEVGRVVNLTQSSEFGIRSMRVNINRLLHQQPK